MRDVMYGVLLAWWAFGIAFAKGFWLTSLAVFCPPVAFVIVAQKIIERYW